MFTIIALVLSVLAFRGYVSWYRRHLYKYDPKIRSYVFNRKAHWSVRFLFDYYGVQAVTFAGMASVAAAYAFDSTGSWYFLAIPPVVSALVLYWLYCMSRKYLAVPYEEDPDEDE